MQTRLKQINYWFDEMSILKVSIFIKYTNESDEIRICGKYLFGFNLSYAIACINNAKKTVNHLN